MFFKAKGKSNVLRFSRTTALVFFKTKGKSNGLMFFKSKSAQLVYGIWYFLSFYVVILLIFVFCYGRILLAIRRQTRVMATHGIGETGGAPCQLNMIKTNLVKTMIFLCAIFAISDKVKLN